MHEYSIVQALMEQVEAQARSRGAIAVHRVSVSLGEMSGVDPDLLASAFEMVRERTICDAATLDIRRVPARWVCSACGAHVAAGGPLRCGACQGLARLAAGDEMMLEQLELEVGDV
jgi:hydrogenase nickel incorporation protein HypA/HybF